MIMGSKWPRATFFFPLKSAKLHSQSVSSPGKMSRDYSGKLDPIRYSQFKNSNSPDKSFQMRLSRWGFSKLKVCARSFFCWCTQTLFASFVVIFAILLWMGAQVDSDTRKAAIIKGFHFVPQGLHEFSVDYVLGVLDCAYEAIEGTKTALFMWSKVTPSSAPLLTVVRLGWWSEDPSFNSPWLCFMCLAQSCNTCGLTSSHGTSYFFKSSPNHRN